MHPVICQIGPLKVFSYGLMLAIAVIVCSTLLSKDAQKKGISPVIVYDFVFWVVVAGLVGARVFFIVLHWDLFKENLLEVFMIQNGGLSWQGGLVLGTFAAWLFLKTKNLPFMEFVDMSAPYVALGQAIGRIGCFLNGCCFGKPASWGIYFPVHGEHLYPTQLFCSAGLIAVFFILKKYQKISNRTGQVFFLYLILASLLRFVVEYYRADHDYLIFGFSEFQLVCVAVFTAGIVGFARLNKPAAGQ